MVDSITSIELSGVKLILKFMLQFQPIQFLILKVKQSMQWFYFWSFSSLVCSNNAGNNY